MFHNIINNIKLIINLNKEIKEKTNILSGLLNDIQQYSVSLKSIEDNIRLTEIELYNRKKELNKTNGIITMEDLGLNYEPTFHNLDTISYKKMTVQEKIGELIGNDEIVITTRTYFIDGSEAKGNQFQKTFCENLLIGFNSYFNQKKKAINSNNIHTSIDLIIKKFSNINKKASLMGVAINQQYLNLCIDLITLELEEKIYKAEEKERIKEERRRLKEQEKLLAEAEKERKKLEEEKKAMNLAYNKALTEEERNKIIEQIQEIDKRIGDIDYRVANPKAGWVYVIESPSLKGMVKIGTSRRLNGPFERVRELSGSSLPEAFKINGFCFSDDAFELENNMHKYFANQRVNPNKEFFYITPQEAIKVLKEEFDCDVHFVNEDESEGEE